MITHGASLRGAGRMHAMQRAAGFTLLEILGALVLLALLLLGVYAGVQTATRSVHVGESSIARLDELRAAQQFLRRELAQSMAVPLARNDKGDNLFFDGGARKMRYVAALPGYLGKLGAQLQQVQLVKNNDGTLRLEASFAMLPPDGSPPHAFGNPEVLLDGIRSGSFSYRGLDDQGKPGNWLDEWPDGRVLPILVSVDLRLADGATWPTLQIPLRVDPSANQSSLNPLQGLLRGGTAR